MTGQRDGRRPRASVYGSTQSHRRDALEGPESRRALHSTSTRLRNAQPHGSASYHDSASTARRDASYAAKQGSRTRQSSSSNTALPLPLRVLSAIGRAIGAFFAALGRAFLFVWSRSRIVGMVILVLLLVGCIVLLDALFTADKVYKGVHVGDVDVSNMTVVQAAEAINGTYTPRLYATSVYIFADEETANSADLDLQMIENDALAEQLSFEEAQANKKLWITSAQALEATLPAQELAEQALSVGRNTGFFDRMAAFFSGYTVPVHATFNETHLDNLISDINMTLGEPMVNFGIAYTDGHAEVTEGNPGYELDYEEFTSEINQQLLADESSLMSFVAVPEYTPYVIDRETAARTCDAINAAVPDKVFFSSEGNTFNYERPTVTNWLSTEVSEQNGSPFLNPFVDHSAASADILNGVNQNGSSDSVQVTFSKEDGQVYVEPQEEVSIPNVEEALTSLDASLFSQFRETGNAPEDIELDTIPINTQVHSGRMTLEDALSYGLVTKFSLYTTQYTNTASTENRKYNIHLAADRINESITKAGEVWSFNETAGQCDETTGFKEAAIIRSDEYTTGSGGGICQVATTVFNAVYLSGLPVRERHNHTLYTSSYPAGRDAAVSYPTLDLRWTNNTSSDILLRTSYTDTSITVSLIGQAPGLYVETDTGDWVEGKKHTTKYEVDESLAADASYVKTAGTDGMEITVVRTVKDSSGNVIGKDSFMSEYLPVTRVIAYGEGSDMAALKEKYAETPAQTTDSSKQGV